jgi:8-oxo-dGTP diphosphatase
MVDSVGYCYRCGNHLGWEQLENRLREICPACGWVHYRQLKLSAAALLINEERLLLLKRAIEPFAKTWYLPAGYVEVDEDPARAAERETLEETGLIVQAQHLLDTILFTDDPRGNGLLLVYACQVLGGELKVNSENEDARFFARTELPDNLCGAGHRQAIQTWFLQQPVFPGVIK